MEKIYKNPFENMKKISLDIDQETLQIIDELVRLTKTSRTAIIGAIIGKGMSPFFRHSENTWKGFLEEKKFDEKKKKKVKELLQGLKKIESTLWDPDHYKE